MLKRKFLNDTKKKLLAEKKERMQKYSQKIDIDMDGDETDEIQANIQIDLQNKFIILNKNKIRMIEEALDRISKETYGLCVDCEEQIPDKRLLVNPYYLTCVSCAEEREMEEKRGKI